MTIKEENLNILAEKISENASLKILLTNDDGVGSPGIIKLKESLEESNQVYIYAPEKQRSSVSHAITLHKPLRMKEIEEKTYSVSGTPADCVYVANFHHKDFDLVISGMNLGWNIGQDVFYSGTVAGAMEGIMRQIPAIAISNPSYFSDKLIYESAKFFSKNLRAIIKHYLFETGLININFPCDLEVPDYKELKIEKTVLGERLYGCSLSINKNPRGDEYIWIGGDGSKLLEIEGNDCWAVRNKKLSITPLRTSLCKSC